MILCSGDKIMIYEENKEKCYHVAEATEDYVKLTNDACYFINETIDLNDKSVHVMSTQNDITGSKDNVTQMVMNKMHNVKQISYEKAIKVLEILMDVDSEE
ncbi:hypothetical protein LXJ15735_32790 [Lacrimispora xylanolytica]